MSEYYGVAEPGAISYVNSVWCLHCNMICNEEFNPNKPDRFLKKCKNNVDNESKICG